MTTPNTNRMSNAQQEKQCSNADCDCYDNLCRHDCCNCARGAKHAEIIRKLQEMYADASPMTPYVRQGYAMQLRSLGHAVDDDDVQDANRVLDFGQNIKEPMTAITNGLKMMADKTNHDKQLKRLGARIKELKDNTDSWTAMKFLHECSLMGGTGPDMSLPFDVAEDRCYVNDIRLLLRTEDKTRENWSSTVKAIMRDISIEYLSEAKQAHLDKIKMKTGETPASYYSRVNAAYGVFTYFAKLEGKPFDEHELAKKWVNGLPQTLASMLNISLHGKAFTMKEALAKAKAANMTGDNLAVPLKAMQSTQGPSQDEMEMERLQQEITQRELSRLRENLSTLNAMSCTIPPAQPASIPPTYQQPYYMNAMMQPNPAGAMKPCEGCGRIGHMIATCWRIHPEMRPDKFKSSNQRTERHRGRSRSPRRYGRRTECRDMINMGSCRFGSNCRFEHSSGHGRQGNDRGRSRDRHSSRSRDSNYGRGRPNDRGRR